MKLREWPGRLGRGLLDGSDGVGSKVAERPWLLVLGLIVLAAEGTALGQL